VQDFALHHWMPQCKISMGRQEWTVSMRIFILPAVAVVLMAIGYAPSGALLSPSKTMALATVKTLSPHEIHLNYRRMKGLPVHGSTNAS
jgi:hypothetical protein